MTRSIIITCLAICCAGGLGAATASNIQMNWPQWEITTAGSNTDMYVDFAGSIKTLPTKYRGMVMIRTSEGDRKANVGDLARINVNVPVTLYVCQDNVEGGAGSWAGSKNGDSFGVSYEAQKVSSFEVYEKNYPAGEIVLGGNHGRAMYIAFIEPQRPGDSLTVSEPELEGARGSYDFGTFSSGAVCYRDNGGTINALSAEAVTLLDGLTTIRAHSGDRRHISANVFSFQLSQATRVYAMIGNDPGGHGYATPAWLSKDGWTILDTVTMRAKASNGATYAHVAWYKDFSAGTVQMPGYKYQGGRNHGKGAGYFLVMDTAIGGITSPTADISVDVTSGDAPLTVNVDARGSSDPDGSITAYDWDFGTGATATGTAASYTFMSAGTYTVTLTVTDDDNPANSDTDTVIITVGGPVVQLPYPDQSQPHTIPGRVEIEDFDSGGEGVAYHDAGPGNQGSSTYRDGEAVDLANCSDVGGGANLGFGEAGEWLEYTVISTGGEYELDLRHASGDSGGSIRLDCDGVDVSGIIALTGTGGWQTWETHTTSGITLPAGEHVLRLSVVSGGSNLNWFELRRTGAVATRESHLSVTPAPIGVDAQHLQTGVTDTLDANGARFVGLNATADHSFGFGAALTGDG